MSGVLTEFMRRHFRHFNAATLVDAAQAWVKHLESGGKMFLTLAGAMSTAELGISLAEMIRQDKIHGISCTGANLEEDAFNLVAHDSYRRIPKWRDLTPQQEQELFEGHLNRVTDTCIPEEEAMRRIEVFVRKTWRHDFEHQERSFPHEHLYRAVLDPGLAELRQIDPRDNWLIAAAERNLPLFVPGWEDSTLGNFFAAGCIRGEYKADQMKSGIEYMIELARWYQEIAQKSPLGFFQIGGGIAGDFPICVVPMIDQDLQRDTPLWAYFCQISDSTTSYGSYSGAVPNEKITWGKLGVDTPSFIIESDATIVAPLIFAHVLGW